MAGGKQRAQDAELHCEMVEEAGVEVLYASSVVGARVEHNAVTGVVIEGRGGRALVACRCAIDATGDGDLAARAGARFLMAPRESLWRICLGSSVFHVDIDQLLERIGNDVVARDWLGYLGHAKFVGFSDVTLDRTGAERILNRATMYI